VTGAVGDALQPQKEFSRIHHYNISKQKMHFPLNCTALYTSPGKREGKWM